MNREMTPEQIELIKKTICKDASDDELNLFIGTAKRMGLDPFAGQIHAVFRNSRTSKGGWEKKMTIQIGISGLRLSADRTGKYVPGRATEFVVNDDTGLPVSATAYVQKRVAGEWHEVAETAHWDEFAQTTKDGKPASLWASKPRVMLAKCAEAMALRRAFPAELSDVYVREEVGELEPVRRTHQIDDLRRPAILAAKAPELPAHDEQGVSEQSEAPESSEFLKLSHLIDSGDTSDEVKEMVRAVKDKADKERLVKLFRNKVSERK